MMAGKCWAMTSFGTSLLRSTRLLGEQGPARTTSIRMTSDSRPTSARGAVGTAAELLVRVLRGRETTFTLLPVFVDHALRPGLLQRSNSAPTEPQATETVPLPQQAGRAVRTELTPTKAERGGEQDGQRREFRLPWDLPREFKRLFSCGGEGRWGISKARKIGAKGRPS